MAHVLSSIGSCAESRAGVVAAGSQAAVAAGLEALAASGNAADAAVATLLALMVTDHGDCSIGGEIPLIIYDAKSGRTQVLCGVGRAPLDPAATRWYMEHGIPGPGDIKMAPVPAVVDLCTTTLQRFGTRSFAQSAEGALALLDAGQDGWHPCLARTLRRLIDEEQRTTGTRHEKLQAVSDRFYGRHRERNDVAEDVVAYHTERGGFIRRHDLAAHRTAIEEPVTVNYRGYTVCKCGPWTQGPMLLQALRLLEGFDLRGAGQFSADYVHIVIEALKLALADRDAYYADPLFADVPLAALLSDAYTALRRPLIDRLHAAVDARPGDPRGMKALAGHGVFRPDVPGTTTCVVADRFGNVVAATPSANVDGTQRDYGPAGVSYGNRLRSLNTTPGHSNCIQPGKRPRITLTPTLVLKGGKPAMAISVAGGDLQDQTTLNVLLDVIEFGMTPREAVSAPRFATYHHQDSFNPNPRRERTFVKAGVAGVSPMIGESVRSELARRGHTVEVAAEPLARPVMLTVAEDGMLRAAGDPAAGRYAGGL